MWMRCRLTVVVVLLTTMSLLSGCRGRQHAHVLQNDDKDMVGSHTAGAETWKPLIEESVCKLLARSCTTIQQASHSTVDSTGNAVRSVCFVGVENSSSEPIGDFKEQIYEHIDSIVSQDPQFRMISRRYVEAAMGECRCNPESLVLPAKQRELQMALERAEQPFDYLLFARITSGTTSSNGDYQRDYKLTLELLDIHTGESMKEFADLRKGYHKSLLGKLKHYND
jgi:Peptidoglycan-synthase activator LpoB